MEQVINGIKLYDTTETAKRLGVSVTTVTRLRTKGLLGYTQLGHYRLTSDEEIALYLKGETRERLQKIVMAQKLLDNLK